MMTREPRSRTCASCLLLLSLALAATTAVPVVADEGDTRAKIDLEVHGVGVPVPGLEQVFRGIGISVAGAACGSDTCRVAPAGKTVERVQIVCQQPCCRALAAGAVLPPPAVHHQAADKISKSELISALIEAMASQAALEATLEERERFEEQREEMFSSLAEVIVEKTRLEAETGALHDKLDAQAQLAEAIVENARLQAKLELVMEREHMVKAYAQAMAENQKLKVHLAKLEQKHAARDVAKTAAEKQARKEARQAAKTAKKEAEEAIQR